MRRAISPPVHFRTHARTIMRRHAVIMRACLYVYLLRSQWRHATNWRNKNRGDSGGPLCFHTRFRSHVSHYYGLIYIFIPGIYLVKGYAVDTNRLCGVDIIQIVLPRRVGVRQSGLLNDFYMIKVSIIISW